MDKKILSLLKLIGPSTLVKIVFEMRNKYSDISERNVRFRVWYLIDKGILELTKERRIYFPHLKPRKKTSSKCTSPKIMEWF